MSTTAPTAAGAGRIRRRFFNRSALLGFVAGAIVAIAGTVSAAAWAMGGWQHGLMMGRAHSVAEATAHADHMLKHFYVEIDATDAQKAQITPLVDQAVADLFPLHAQLPASHEAALKALMQPTIDRDALETVRAEHLKLADQASKRLIQLVSDVGNVLTLAQRKALVEHLQQIHGMGATPNT